MKRGYTTIEQSKKLLELGIDPCTADMIIEFGMADILHNPNLTKEHWESMISSDFYPCWSLTALIELMPIIDYNTPNLNQKLDKRYYYSIRMDNAKRIDTSSYDTPIDAAIEFIEWAVKNRYIKTNK